MQCDCRRRHQGQNEQRDGDCPSRVSEVYTIETAAAGARPCCKARFLALRRGHKGVGVCVGWKRAR